MCRHVASGKAIWRVAQQSKNQRLSPPPVAAPLVRLAAAAAAA
eukprot:CAMPEP_0172667158 /NCGR_PEP_ID=MMETSP1074-20121228/8247_1 /TAXON_ID=2916 /ORGANISM="Ceratium fusus, Strain PA161109" /LENGTH=42 /DNA_ID= /DNA_START= /DNA_END= /DNA_ORIENTATION=